MEPVRAPNASTYLLVPRISVGRVTLGQPVPTTAEFRDAVETQIHPWARPELHFAAGSLRLNRDRDDNVREITVVEPAQLRWGDIDLVGRGLRDVVRDLRRAGIRVRTARGEEADAPEIGIGLWAESGTVTGATASDPDNPMPTPSVDDVLKAYGMSLGPR